MAVSKKKVLILCTGNSARSQMAEGLLRSTIDPDVWDIFSAGTEPSAVRSEAVTAMKEIGIDISSQRSKSVDEFLGKPIDIVLTVCDNAKENCPYFPGASATIHRSFPDPAAVSGDEEMRLRAFREVRDEIAEYFRSEFSKTIAQNERGAI